ncbi:MAG: hypothetical protein WBR18_12660 [Anaerolineales bacterium]
MAESPDWLKAPDAEFPLIHICEPAAASVPAIALAIARPVALGAMVAGIMLSVKLIGSRQH